MVHHQLYIIIVLITQEWADKQTQMVGDVLIGDKQIMVTTNIITQGWGRLGWGSQSYGDAPTVTLSGQQATTGLGSLTVELRPGWGTLDWGENGWGSVEEGIEVLTGQQATSAVGSITPADVIGLTGQGATSNVGALLLLYHLQLH